MFKGVGETKRQEFEKKKKEIKREKEKRREAFRLFRLSRTNLPSCKRHRRVVLTNWGAPGRSRLRAGYTRPTFRPPKDLCNRHRNERSLLSSVHSPPRSHNPIRQSKSNQGFLFFLGKKVENPHSVRKNSYLSRIVAAGFIVDHHRFPPRVGHFSNRIHCPARTA